MSSMTRNNQSKINKLLKSLSHPGIPLTTSWLRKHGISHKLAWWYVQSGWFDRIADGLYCLAGNKIVWSTVVVALQEQMLLPIYPGGKTALQLLGRGHFINPVLQDIQLFAPTKTKVPRWLRATCWETQLTVYRTGLFEKDNKQWYTQLELDGHLVQVSAPEKAALELCYLVPREVTFVEAALIIEGLSRMRSDILQTLLEHCQSYKVKRLLLYLGDYFKHHWMNDIDLSRIELGKGKQVIAGGGHYHAKYRLSAPQLRGNL